MKMRFPVGQELDFEVLQRFLHRLHARRTASESPPRCGTRPESLAVEIELGKDAGRKKGRHQLVHDADGDVDRGKKDEEENGEPGEPSLRLRQPDAERRGQRRRPGAGRRRTPHWDGAGPSGGSIPGASGDSPVAAPAGRAPGPPGNSPTWPSRGSPPPSAAPRRRDRPPAGDHRRFLGSSSA